MGDKPKPPYLLTAGPDSRYTAAARAVYQSEDVEIDDDARLSPTEDGA